MEINDEILEILSELKIQKDNGICYLLSLFYGYKPEFIPDTFKQRMNITGIYQEERGSIKWNVPLFEGQQTAFEWVKDYCQYNEKKIKSLPESELTGDDKYCIENNFFNE